MGLAWASFGAQWAFFGAQWVSLSPFSRHSNTYTHIRSHTNTLSLSLSLEFLHEREVPKTPPSRIPNVWGGYM